MRNPRPLRLTLAATLLGAAVTLASPAVAETETETESQDREVVGTFDYVCDLNAPAQKTWTIPVQVTSTLPESVTPGSSVNLPFLLSMTMPGEMATIARSNGYEYLVAYSDNLQINVAHDASTDALTLPRVAAAQPLPAESGDFVVQAKEVNTLLDIGEDSEGTYTISLPTSDQIAHPRSDIGGRISFTFAIQMYEDEAAYTSGAQPERAMLICSAATTTDLTLGSFEVSETGEERDDEQGTNEEVVVTETPEVVITESEVFADETPFADGVSSIGSGEGVVTSSLLGSGEGVATVPVAEVSAPAAAPEATADASRTVSFGTDASASTPRVDDSDGLGAVLLAMSVLMLVGSVTIIGQHRRALSRLKN
ncbi:MAG: hypothetical protein QM597_04255 [Aeromicrobium sp.]|uniref:DUF6801 domain-containing protein n=1 Tax=Aeromicrobium sp. TaxID=1871063 RepID=UPI0039E2DC07